MTTRKLDVSTGAGGEVTVRRNRFDQHLNHCTTCTGGMCSTAQSLWRAVCLAAVREARRNTPVGPKLDGAL